MAPEQEQALMEVAGGRSLVTHEAARQLSQPVIGGPQMVEALKMYRQLQRALDDEMPDALMELDGKQFRKKPYWRAIALAFGLTVEPVDERREVSGTFEDGKDNFGYVVTYRATAPNGRAGMGDGACFAVEKARRFKCPHPEREGSTRTKHWPHESCPDYDPTYQWRALPGQATEHNVRSHAHTRAYNRAVSNLVAFGEVSAEEVEAGHGTATTTAAAAPARDAGPLRVTGVTSKPTKNPRVTRYEVAFSDGSRATTIKDQLAAAARTLQASGTEVDAVIEPTQYGLELRNVAPKDGLDQRTPASEAAEVALPGYDDPAGPEGEAGEPGMDRELVTSTREITRGGKTVYGIKTTRTEYFTDDVRLRDEAAAACAAQKGVFLVAEAKPAAPGKPPVAWLTEVRL